MQLPFNSVAYFSANTTKSSQQFPHKRLKGQFVN